MLCHQLVGFYRPAEAEDAKERMEMRLPSFLLKNALLS
jgi:hypothetical protein